MKIEPAEFQDAQAWLAAATNHSSIDCDHDEASRDWSLPVQVNRHCAPPRFTGLKRSSTVISVDTPSPKKMAKSPVLNPEWPQQEQEDHFPAVGGADDDDVDVAEDGCGGGCTEET